jgi:serine acetyltransferase
VRLWVAKVRKHAVAHVLGDEPIGLGDEISAAAVVCADDLAHVFGVEARRERG